MQTNRANEGFCPQHFFFYFLKNTHTHSSYVTFRLQGHEINELHCTVVEQIKETFRVKGNIGGDDLGAYVIVYDVFVSI